MRWLITGGCGFIGRSLIHELTAEGGHTIRVVDNLSVGSRADLAEVAHFVESPAEGLAPLSDRPGEPVELVVGDILDADLALAAAAGANVIVHLAANTGVAPSVENPRADCVTNVIGTLNYLEAARHGRVGRFVFASSGAPIGECEPPIHEELAPHPVSPYGASKLAGEGYCSAYARTFGVQTVALRFGNVYGPNSGHKSSVVAKFIRNAMAGEPLEVYGDGRQTRDFIYIGDLVRAIRRAAVVDGIGGQAFQIATNAETTVGELVDLLVPLLEDAGIGDLKVRHGEPRLGDVRRNFSDTSKAARVLGWRAGVRLGEGLKETLDWFEVQSNARR
jgi:UDP-glucose 4-epimerase